MSVGEPRWPRRRAGSPGSSRCSRRWPSRAFLVCQQHALLLNEIAILALFALSLDLILGYAGIVSLGHAAFFGIGAYAAALFAKHVMPDPLVGLVVAIGVAALLGALSSVLDPARLRPDAADGHAGRRR